MVSTLRARRATALNSFALVAAAALPLAATVPSQASSHREAPFITTRPKVDGTDFYMFNSYEAGRAGYRHPHRQLPAAAGSTGRSELFHDGPQGAVRNHIDNTAPATRS